MAQREFGRPILDPPRWSPTRRLRLALGGFTAVMMGLSWPLWINPVDIPAVPFWPHVPQPIRPIDWGVFLGALVAIGWFATGRSWRVPFFGGLALLFFLILNDQHRFQPWIYQFAMTGSLLAGLPEREGLRYCRLWYVLLYFHSGLSKLDVSFRDELGLLFITTLLRPLGLEPREWSALVRTLVVLTLPLGELLVAGALLTSKFRRVGLLGATVTHLGLIGVLGPLGLDHSPIVLVWNLAVLIQVWIAFTRRSNQTRRRSRPFGRVPSGEFPPCWSASRSWREPCFPWGSA
ncbi:MAG: hypothetical protein AB7I30_18050, partial [Isosphaeraceae bacterium]